MRLVAGFGRKKAVPLEPIFYVPVDNPSHRTVKFLRLGLDEVAVPFIRLECNSVLRCHKYENIRNMLKCQDICLNPLALSYSIRYDMNMNMNIEQWKQLPGFEVLYEVSSHGRMHRISSGYIGACTRGSGENYPAIVLHDGHGHTLTRYVHQLVAMVFIPGFCPGMHVNHKDGNVINNNVENLEWVTPSLNSKHAWYRRRFKRGCKPSISAYNLPMKEA